MIVQDIQFRILKQILKIIGPYSKSPLRLLGLWRRWTLRFWIPYRRHSPLIRKLAKSFPLFLNCLDRKTSDAVNSGHVRIRWMCYDLDVKRESRGSFAAPDSKQESGFGVFATLWDSRLFWRCRSNLGIGIQFYLFFKLINFFFLFLYHYPLVSKMPK